MVAITRRKRRPQVEPSQSLLTTLLASADNPFLPNDFSTTSTTRRRRRGDWRFTWQAPLDLLVRDPEPPRATVTLTRPAGYDSPADAICISSGQFTTALLNIDQNLGRTYVIEVVAGLTFTGNFRLPNKTGPNAVVIRTSNFANLPASGSRVGPSNAINMAKIVSNVANTPALRFNEQAHDYFLIGLEVTTTVSTTDNLIKMGSSDASDSTLTSLSLMPIRNVIDQCYVHGIAGTTVRRGILGNARYVGVVDSYVSEIHQVGADTQAFGAWQCEVVTLRNSYFEAAGENIFFGGAAPSITNHNPSDITISNCYAAKPLSWKIGDPTYAGFAWSVKNLVELKNAIRVHVEGCVFERNWAHAQTGFAVQITPRNDTGTARWSTVGDVTFINNIVRNTGSGINFIPADAPNGTGNDYSDPMRRVSFRNNLIKTDSANFGGNGRLIQLAGSTTSSRIAMHLDLLHNTLIHESPGQGFVEIGDVGKFGDDVRVMDNMTTSGTYGIHSPSGVGTAGMNGFLTNYRCAGNALIKDGNFITDAAYPAGNFFPLTTASVGFTNSSGGDYSLTAGSAYHNAATDGTDIGVDWAALLTATDRVVEGTPAPAPSTGKPFYLYQQMGGSW